MPTGALHLSHFLFSSLVACTLLFLMVVGQQYSPARRISRLHDSVALLKSALVAYLFALGVAVVMYGFFGDVGRYSLAVIAVHVAIVLGSMILVRYALWAYQRRLFLGGAGSRKVLLAGSGSAASEFLDFLRDRWWLGLRAVGTLTTDGARPQGHDLAVPVVGGMSNAREEFDAAGADEVIVALDPPERAAFPRLAESLVQARIPFRIVPSLFEEGYRPAKLAGLDGVPVVGMTFMHRERVEREVKRFCDQLMALTALIVAAPLVLVIVVAIKLTSRGPVYHRQQRVGHNGRTFTMYKFRTMVDGAEASTR